MTARYRNDFSCVLDGDASEKDLEEILTILSASDAQRRDFRKQLLLDQLLAQALDPTRSARAFSTGLMTRIRAEREADPFLESVLARGSAGSVGAAPRRRDKIVARRTPMPASSRWLFWGAMAAGLAVLAGAYFINLRKAERTPPIIIGKLAKLNAVVVERNGREITGFAGMDLFVNDVVRTGKDGEARVEYGEETTTVALTSNAECGILRRSSLALRSFSKGGSYGGQALNAEVLELRKGTLTAEVAKREGRFEPRMGTDGHGWGERPFVVETPHAIVRVKGTRFSVDVDKVSSRLEVREGVVNLTRLSDGESVDVAGGQYAVAKPGVELAALALAGTFDKPSIPPAGMRFIEDRKKSTKSKYGRIVFQDEFDGDLSNWEVVAGMESDGFTVLTENPERHAFLDRNVVAHPGTQSSKYVMVRNCVAIDPGDIADRFVGIRSKKPIDLERFVVEVLFCLSDRRKYEPRKERPQLVWMDGLEWLPGSMRVVYPAEYKTVRWWQTWRFECAREGERPDSDTFRCRRIGWIRDKAFWYARSSSRKILLVVRNREMLIARIVVRELPEDMNIVEPGKKP